MGVRDTRQLEAVHAFLSSDQRSIINACPRFGKIRVAFKIMTKLQPPRVLLLAPRRDIFTGWESEKVSRFIPAIWDNITFTSISKISNEYDFIILDEPHELSLNQQATLKEKLKNYKGPILGLTGTMTEKTKEELYDSLNLDTCYKYTINQGVEDGILADYEIRVHQVSLEKEEKKKFSRMNYSLLMTTDGLRRHFISLKMIHLLQNSKAKAQKTKELISKYKDERILVFCGVTEIADNLGIPVYHSKAREKKIFNEFCSGGDIDQLATIKMMQAGVTINPIHRGIVNYMSGNPEDSAQKICRFLGFEYQNPNKKAVIEVVSSTEDFELQRMKTGLRFFDGNKITYL